MWSPQWLALSEGWLSSCRTPTPWHMRSNTMNANTANKALASGSISCRNLVHRLISLLMWASPPQTLSTLGWCKELFTSKAWGSFLCYPCTRHPRKTKDSIHRYISPHWPTSRYTIQLFLSVPAAYVFCLQVLYRVFKKYKCRTIKFPTRWKHQRLRLKSLSFTFSMSYTWKFKLLT